MEQQRYPVWLDCDPGNDDAFAIILSAYHPKINLLGISTACGNTSAEKTSLNACKILYASGIDGIDVVKGADAPFCGKPLHAINSRSEDVHGQTGLGTDKFLDPPNKPLMKNAILHMYETIIESKQKVKVVCTGAQTNVALLLKSFPDVKDNIDEIAFMGGSINFGNITPCAEFNIYCDPEAAEIVCQSGLRVSMVPLEVTRTAKVTKEVKERILNLQSKYADACVELLDFYADACKTIYGFDTCHLHDPCAIAYLIAPELFTTVFCAVEIERYSEKARGRTICDIYNCGNNPKNVTIATKMDVPKFWDIMIGAIELANAKNRVN